MKGKGKINMLHALQCFYHGINNLSLRNKLFEAPADPELHHTENICSSYTFSRSNILKQRKCSVFLRNSTDSTIYPDFPKYFGWLFPPVLT